MSNLNRMTNHNSRSYRRGIILILLFVVLLSGSFSAAAQVVVDDSGKVGIGTTSPGEKLEVNGSLKITGGGSIYSTAWTDVSFESGWSNYQGGFQTVQYKKVGDLVFIRGTSICPGSGCWSAHPIIFSLPVGFTPKAHVNFAKNEGNTTGLVRIQVSSSGNVTWINGGSGADIIFLDGIVFSVD